MIRILVSLFIFIMFTVPAFSQENVEHDIDNSVVEVVDTKLKLKKEIKKAIIEIYGKDLAEDIYTNVLVQANKAISERSDDLLRQDYERDFDWYKNEIIYMFYVDQFGVVSDK